MIPGLKTFIQKQTVSSASELFLFYCTVNTVCNPDFILSYLESEVLWSVNVEWAIFCYFLPVESLSRVWSSCAWREGESEVLSGAYYSPVLIK